MYPNYDIHILRNQNCLIGTTLNLLYQTKAKKEKKSTK